MDNSNITIEKDLTKTSADSNISPQLKEPSEQQSATMYSNNNNSNNNQPQQQQQSSHLQSPAGDIVASNQSSTGVNMRQQLDNFSNVIATNPNTSLTMDPLQQQSHITNNDSQQMNLPSNMTLPSGGPYQQQPPPPPTHPIHQPLLADDTKSDIALDIVPSSISTNQDSNQQQQQQPSTPQKSIITKVKLSDELNIFDWFRTTDIINQIAEKAKSSVDSVITTLDPGMKEYLYSGGNVNIVVISDTSRLVSPIRDAFQSVFGRATVVAARYNPPATIIDYPVRIAKGFQEAVVVAQEKIKKFRQDTNSVAQNQVVVVVQAALVCIDGTKGLNSNNQTTTSATPDDNPESKWFLTYCMLIEDPVLNLTMKSYSQFVPMDELVMEVAKTSRFPDTFRDSHLGYSMSIDELMGAKLRLSLEELAGDENGCLWLPKWAGLYETQLIHELSLSLANAYRRRWNDCASIETVS